MARLKTGGANDDKTSSRRFFGGYPVHDCYLRIICLEGSYEQAILNDAVHSYIHSYIHTYIERKIEHIDT